MATEAIRQFVGNRNPSVTDTIRVDGVAFDLSSSTVRFKMRLEGSSTLKVDAAATIVVAASGTVRYDWAALDVDTAGDYVAWWEVTTTGKTQDTAEFPVYILEHSASGLLATLGDLREYLQKPQPDRAQDEALTELLRRASRVIERYTEREFTPTTSATRRFRVDRYRANLAPYDLRTATTVTLNPETASPDTLTAYTDYLLEPVTSIHGTYTTIRLNDRLSMDSDTYQNFGFALLDVAGAWGFAAVPSDVRHACVVTAGLWARRELQAFSATFNLDEARVERPEALPAAVRAMLAPYRRVVVI